MTIDAPYFKVREKSRVISKAFMIAYATNSEGYREIIGFDIYRNESKETRNTFLKGLKSRGLTGMKMITSDAHEGIIDAISKQFPEVPWQRCQFHFSRNITHKTPARYQKGLASELQEMFNCKTIEAARKRRDEIIADYKEVAEDAMICLDEGFEDAMTVMVLPGYLHKYFRTSNQIERLNKELKRRSKVIGVFPNENSLMRLMGAVLMERNDHLASLRRVFKSSTLQELMSSDLPLKLINIAREQHQLLAA